MKTVATAFYDWLMLDLAELCCETPSDVNHIDSVLLYASEIRCKTPYKIGDLISYYTLITGLQ